ncbi:MAG: amidohydrolase family protein [Planctomycetales bacterium]|nr:amidohydrolase family protein [Planctomycetales bacterium]
MTTLGGQILLPGPTGQAVIREGIVKIDGEQIISVDFEDVTCSVDLGCPNALISPGFIDTHLHLPQFDSIGAFGMPLMPWLNQVILPAEQRWNDHRFAAEMTDRVARQCLGVGTTGVCAYATTSYDATIQALKAFDAIGFRGVIGQAMMDRDTPPDLIRPTDQLVDEVNETLLKFPSSGRLAAAVTPRFALSCSDGLMMQAGKLAEAHQAIMQTHLAETEAECAEVRNRFGGKSYVDVYAGFGLLGPRSIFGHGIHLGPECQSKLARSGSLIAHCPTANSFLGSGTMNRASHLSAGVKITLGSDIGAGYERSMVRVGRAMIDAAMRIAGNALSSTDPRSSVPNAAEAWYQITTGNADALGWTDVGRIASGMSADLCVIEPDIPWRSAQDPLSALMFAWDDRWIRQTILRGQVQYQSTQSSSMNPVAATRSDGASRP